jgi:hypothetical protein
VINSEVWWNPGSRMGILAKRLKKLSLAEQVNFAFYQSKAYLGLVDQRRQFPIDGVSRFSAYKKAKAPLGGPETIRIFDYLPWDQDEIEKTLKEETGWRKPDQSLTWRYDCILEPLLDYTFKKDLGISSAGLYLCGLIRSGGISREEALQMMQSNEDPARLEASLRKVFDFLDIPESVQEKYF